LSDYKEEALPRDEPMEEDPLAKERKAQQQLTEQRDVASQALASPHESQEDLVSLFGPLWPLPSNIGDIVKLTPEVGREVMGKQLAYLKRRINDERVWKFEPKAQHWMRLRFDEEAS
ncbi:DUF3275 family protein, partial [Vibrio sp. 10N.222.49.E4]